MANFVYNYAKLKLLTGQIDLDTDDIRVLLVKTGSPLTNDELEFVSSGGSIAAYEYTAGANYVRKQLSESVVVDLPNNRAEFTSSTITWTALGPDGSNNITAAVFYKHVSTDANSPLLAYFDTATGLPLLPNGGDVQITFNAEGLLQLT